MKGYWVCHILGVVPSSSSGSRWPVQQSSLGSSCRHTYLTLIFTPCNCEMIYAERDLALFQTL
jgi:hypothetical protein